MSNKPVDDTAVLYTTIRSQSRKIFAEKSGAGIVTFKKMSFQLPPNEGDAWFQIMGINKKKIGHIRKMSFLSPGEPLRYRK
jgi:hypothetical protein